MEECLDTQLGDLEQNSSEEAFLLNNTVHCFAWRQLIVTVKDRQTRKAKDLICDINGRAEQGMCLTKKNIPLSSRCKG
jgi:hypothetical protein